MKPLRPAFFVILCVLVLIARVGSVYAENAIRVAVPARPPGLGNPYASMATPGLHPWAYMFDALTRLEDDGSVGPALATEWHVETPTRWVFSLRPNVQFANGEPFSADAVAFAIAILQDPRNATFYAASEIKSIATIEVIDQLTIAIETHTPDAILDRRLSHVYLVPPNLWRTLGPEDFAMKPVGTGPYQLTDWATRSSKFSLVRNPSSWRASADVDRIEFSSLVDATTRMQALITGEVDIAFNVALDSFAALEDAGMTIRTRERSPVEGIALPNHGKNDALKDRRVRQAMNYAVNKEAIATALLSGLTQPNGQGAISEMFGYDPSIPAYPYDPARAEALLAEAGYADGFAVTLVVRLEGKGPEWAGIYQALVQDLTRVGINVTLRSTPSQEWLRMWFSGDWGDADMTPFGWTSTYRDAGRAIETVSCAKPGAFFCVPDMMPRIEAAAAEMNPETRRTMLQKLLADLHELAPSIYLFPQIETLAHSNVIKSLPIEGGYYRLEQVRSARN